MTEDGHRRLREFERKPAPRPTRINSPDALRQAELKRAEERKLANRLVDIGYKVMAAKLHPDKGGSHEAMARLNRARDLGKR